MKKIINEYASTGIDYRTFRIMQSEDFGSAHAQPVPDNFYSRAIYAQFLHETGKGTSRIFKDYNNLFGMRPAQSRPKFYVDTADTSTGRYAVYNNASDSIADRENLDEYNHIVLPMSQGDIANYYQAVKDKGYATDPMYVNRCIAVYNETFGTQPIGAFEDYNDPTGGHPDYNEDEEGSSWFSDFLAGIGLKIALPTLAIVGVAVWYFFLRKKN